MKVRQLTTSHWGIYEVVSGADGLAQGRGIPEDPDPSPIGLSMFDAYRSPIRIGRPAVRRGWLERGPDGDRSRRGQEPFVEVPWETALDLVAREIERVRSRFGNASIFGGSYGWASAGRFHHAQGQVHRFLNCVGGYVRHMDSYSLGAARVLMPHIMASMDELMLNHDPWDVVVEHTKLFVCFGGIPAKNAQVTMGGSSEHRVRPALAELARRGCRFANFSPVDDNLDAPAGAVEWIPLRPNSDTAVMLALTTTIIREGLHDRDFLARYCVGYDAVEDYLLGRRDGMVKDAAWAAALSGVPAARIESLARELVGKCSIVNVAWALQRAEYGEQPFWAAVLLAAVVGKIGLPGGGVAFGYGAINLMGTPHSRISGPTLPQGRNRVEAFIPVARIADMLLHPREPFDYNGDRHAYPDIRLVYWAGGNPFHHHQDLNKLLLAWRVPETIIVHEQAWTATAKHADIVLPATSSLERCDIGFANRDPLMVAMKPCATPPGEAKDDYEIFAELGGRLGCREEFTEGRDTMQWLAHLYEDMARRLRQDSGAAMPPFCDFWLKGHVVVPKLVPRPTILTEFRRDPAKHPLPTPSGRIELFSARIAGFGYANCPGHPTWIAPLEWLGSPAAERFPLHLISDQPSTKLHSQLDFSDLSRAAKRADREPLAMNRRDAEVRGIADGDLVEVFNDRGRCLAAAALSDGVARGVVKLSTGAWYDPALPGVPGTLEKHGNPNVLTRDVGSSKLSQGCTAQSCLVEVRKHVGVVPPVTAFVPPAVVT